jgi:hypothetical protein
MTDQASNDTPRCLYCQRDSEQIPLVSLLYRKQNLWICPEHLPILIHKPHQLVGKLPGAENFESAPS